jgi:hypothetical protein
VKHPAWSVVVLVLALVEVSCVSNLGAQPRRSGGANGGAAKAEVWAVFKIGDDVSVDKQSELKSLKKKADDDYKQEMSQYKEAIKAGGKGGKNKSDAPKKPVKRTVKLLKGGFKTQQAAEEWKDKYQGDKKDDPKAGKKTPR